MSMLKSFRMVTKSLASAILVDEALLPQTITEAGEKYGTLNKLLTEETDGKEEHNPPRSS